MRATGAAILLSLAASQAAGDFLLRFPVDCTLGSDCFIQQYVDHDPGPEAQDFTCGSLSYDGHNGTDIALFDMAALAKNIDVLAAADGLVAAVRDGEPDTGIAGATPGKECGNGVAVSHGDGWVTQYCHLKQGSLRVLVGETVAAGAPLGQIGFSGQTEFPHLHLSLRHNDQIVDPFAPHIEDCGEEPTISLWQEDIAYTPGGLIAIGLASRVPEFDEIKDGSLPALVPSATTPAIVLFAHMFGTRTGDTLSIKLHSNAAQIFSQRFILVRDQARSFRAFGRRKPENGWPVGGYTGQAELSREGRVIGKASIDFQVAP